MYNQSASSDQLFEHTAIGCDDAEQVFKPLTPTYKNYKCKVTLKSKILHVGASTLVFIVSNEAKPGKTGLSIYFWPCYVRCVSI